MTKQEQSFKIGTCSDAWKLRCVGDPEDIIDHRGYYQEKY